MTRQFNVVIEKDADGFFVAFVPAPRGCHTQARSLDVLMERIREAIELCIEVEEQEPIYNEFIGISRVAVTVWAHGKSFGIHRNDCRQLSDRADEPGLDRRRAPADYP
uniref:Predicted nuclease of the RNAse H fold, HicB family n=1 Tax=Candidatus Kentrum sp. FW TaxID=2126338 RepID=A0A450T7X6_9GAMM|nr:MAG: Predicted nuclease of the RNAse H fold, HicB family [Candidatus Kentron sp. FW]VFJ62823.1 MAG: Predicted nuclease of the RNAse H fold, HicB family [Candidatus Kentron sp. FW]